MSMKKMLLIVLLLSNTVYANKPISRCYTLYDQHPWSMMYYYGKTYSNPLFHVIILNKLHRWPEHIQTAELTKTLATDNFLRQALKPIVDTVQLAGNITLRDGSNQNHPIYEFNPYLLFRWSIFPWNDYLSTSFAIGEGVSYATAIPSLERKDNPKTKRLLNFLALEASIALPQYPELQLVARVHHRSGAFGLYGAGNTGSNALGIGIRYLFD